MSYKCAIFGHRYGEAEVEREREEDGSEVITVERETETCVRCGHVRVVSENKEVRTVETAADIVADDLAAEHTGETAPPPEPDESAVEAASIAEEVEQPRDPAEEDAVILDDDDDDEREPGEWPKEPPTEEETPEADGVAEPDTVEESEDGARASWELPSDIDPHPGTEQPSSEPPGSTLTVPEGEFYCPNCEFTAAVESSSLRAGDYCPQCHRGSLEHRRE